MTGKRRFVGRPPGRIDLLGGRAVYRGGMVIEATTAESAWATVGLRADRRICLFNPQAREIGWQDQVEFTLDDLGDDERVRQLVRAEPGIRWTAYALGSFFL